MKRLLITLCGIIFTILLANSEPYKSLFGKGTTQWNVYEMVPDYGGTVIIGSFSDTLINDKLYHTIYNEPIYQVSETIGPYAEICGYMREDTVSGKCWILYNNQETLLMDLSLNKGDNFQMLTDYEFQTIDDILVDSVYYEDGRKIIELDTIHYGLNYSSKVKLIEGIGPSTGLFPFYSAHRFVLSNYILCKFENGKHVYSSEMDDGNCFYPVDGDVEESMLDNYISIYPNPSSSVIYIKIEEGFNIQDASLTVINITGKIILQKTIHSKLESISIENEGLYLLRIENKDGNVTGKVLVSY
jgi:hypothetical protein